VKVPTRPQQALTTATAEGASSYGNSINTFVDTISITVDQGFDQRVDLLLIGVVAALESEFEIDLA
jgi:hypothetical protein